MKYVAFASVLLENNVSDPGRAELLRNQSETCYCFFQALQVAQQQQQQQQHQQQKQQQQASGEKSPKSTEKESDTQVEPCPPPPAAHTHLQRTLLFTLLHKPTCLCCLRQIINRWRNEGCFIITYFYDGKLHVHFIVSVADCKTSIFCLCQLRDKAVQLRRSRQLWSLATNKHAICQPVHSCLYLFTMNWMFITWVSCECKRWS